MRIDHLIITVGDLDRAAGRLWERHGLASMEGGVHPRWGTGNRLVPVGFAYLELMAVLEPERARHTELGRWVERTATEEGHLASWAVEVEAMHSLADHLGLRVLEGSRTRPDGAEVRYRLAALEEALAEPPLPFFIEWEDLSQRPDPRLVRHRVQVDDLLWVELAGDRRRVEEWLGGADLPLRWADGSPGLRRAAIATDGDPIVLD